jgi:hypothetical protein
MNNMPGMRAVATALTVSGAAFAVPHTSTIGPELLPPAIDRKQAAYLGLYTELGAA